jgi:uncharacterized membrane protein
LPHVRERYSTQSRKDTVDTNSFIVIGAIWINHHAMFESIDHIDQEMLLLNTLHLLFVAFLPFPTAVLATVSAFASPWLAVFCFVALNVFFLWPRRKSRNSAA